MHLQCIFAQGPLCTVHAVSLLQSACISIDCVIVLGRHIAAAKIVGAVIGCALPQHALLLYGEAIRMLAILFPGSCMYISCPLCIQGRY